MRREHALGRRLVMERFHSFPGAMILFRWARNEIGGRGMAGGGGEKKVAATCGLHVTRQKSPENQHR